MFMTSTSTYLLLDEYLNIQLYSCCSHCSKKQNNFTKEFKNTYKKNSLFFPDNHPRELETVSPLEMTLTALIL